MVHLVILIDISRIISANGATIPPQGPMVLLLRISQTSHPMERGYSAFLSLSIAFIQEERELSKSYTISCSQVPSTADHNGGRLSLLLARVDRERHNSVLNSQRETEAGTTFFLYACCLELAHCSYTYVKQLLRSLLDRRYFCRRGRTGILQHQWIFDPHRSPSREAKKIKCHGMSFKLYRALAFDR